MNAMLLTKGGVNSRPRNDNSRMNFISFSQSSQNTNRDGTSIESGRSNTSNENEIVARSRHLEILDLLHNIKAKLTEHEIRFNELEMQISNKSTESSTNTVSDINQLAMEISKKLEFVSENVPIISLIRDEIFRIHQHLEMEKKYRSTIADYLKKISRHLSIAKDDEGYVAWENSQDIQVHQIRNEENCYEDDMFFEGKENISTLNSQRNQSLTADKHEEKEHSCVNLDNTSQTNEINSIMPKNFPLIKAEEFEISSQISTEIEL